MSNLGQIGRSPTFWLGLLLILSYWFWAPLVTPSANITIEWLRVFLAVFGGTVIIAYLPGVYHFLVQRAPAHASQLVMGIVVAAGGAVGATLWLLLWRLAGFPPWMVQTYLNGFFIWMTVVGYLLHISAPRAIEDAIPRPNWQRIWIALGVSVAAGYLIHSIAPNASDFVEWLRPYVL